jgi:hypothetical protein
LNIIKSAFKAKFILAMAKLTVFFKYKAIDTFSFEQGVVHIGQDETNDLTIDSLAVAPAHAAIVSRDGVATIRQLHDNFPLIVNGQKVKECELKHNDTITLGKHDIVYSLTESVSDEPQEDDNHFDYSKAIPQGFGAPSADDEQILPPASLQVMSGASIGKVLPLKKAMTRLGSAGNGVVVITKRKDGYYVSALDKKGILTINGTPLGDRSVKLSFNDIIAINQIALQFF